MKLSDAQIVALNVRDMYEKINRKDGQKSWLASDYVSGLVGDIGDLQKLVMAKDVKRDFKPSSDITIDQAIEHELVDILWSVLILAKEYNVDLEKSFAPAMEKLKEKLLQRL